jgi:hypothetical protein
LNCYWYYKMIRIIVKKTPSSNKKYEKKMDWWRVGVQANLWVTWCLSALA